MRVHVCSSAVFLGLVVGHIIDRLGAHVCVLVHLLPPPLATWDTNQIAQFYSKHATSIRWGAVVGAETSGFFVPFWVVVSLQIARLDRGKVWAIAAFAGGR